MPVTTSQDLNEALFHHCLEIIEDPNSDPRAVATARRLARDCAPDRSTASSRFRPGFFEPTTNATSERLRSELIERMARQADRGWVGGYVSTTSTNAPQQSSNGSLTMNDLRRATERLSRFDDGSTASPINSRLQDLYNQHQQLERIRFTRYGEFRDKLEINHPEEGSPLTYSPLLTEYKHRTQIQRNQDFSYKMVLSAVN